MARLRAPAYLLTIEQQEIGPMVDLAFLVLGIGFFLAAALAVAGCERI